MPNDNTINQRIDHLGIRLDNAVMELGFVLKAIEELSIEKGVMTRADIQKKIIELSDSGWEPIGGMEEGRHA